MIEMIKDVKWLMIVVVSFALLLWIGLYKANEANNRNLDEMKRQKQELIDNCLKSGGRVDNVGNWAETILVCNPISGRKEE